MMHPSAELKILHPESLTDAQKLLSQLTNSSSTVRVLGGGTDLMPHFKKYPKDHTTLISLSGLDELKKIQKKDAKLFIGAQIKLVDLEESDLIREYLSELSCATRLIASPQIRNQATVAGNLLVNNRCLFYNQSPTNRAYHQQCFKSGGEVCHVISNAKRGQAPLCRARFVSDLAPIFLSLNAQLRLFGPKGERMINLSEFYLPDGINRHQLKADELIVEVVVDLTPKYFLAYEKLRVRQALDFPSLGVAVCREVSDKSTLLRLALTGVQTHPILVADLVRGLSEDTFGPLLAQAIKQAQPLKQDFFSPSYRRQMIPVLSKRAFAKVKG